VERTTRARRRPAADSDAAHRIFASSADALFLIDPDGRLTAWSPGAERTFARRAADVLGRPAAEVSGGAWAERLPELLRSVLGEDRCRHEEVCGSRGDGTELCLDLMLSPVRDASGSPGGIVGVAREVGERRRLEDTIRSREGRLVEVARMTTAGEILDGLAHEVYQPLTSIGSYAGACQNLTRSLEGPTIESLRSYVRKIVEQTGAAAEILRRARRFVRRSEEPVAFELGDLARESIALIRSEQTLRHVTVTVEADRPATVMGDRSHIEQVMVNLLRNAYESFEPDHRDRRVTVHVAADDGVATVAVRDHGVGVGADAFHLAESFHSTKEHGLGLGLGICRNILERHHGSLCIEAAPEGGTVARFTLPLHRPRGDRV